MGARSLFLPCGSWKFNSGHQAWRQALLPTKSSPRPWQFLLRQHHSNYGPPFPCPIPSHRATWTRGKPHFRYSVNFPSAQRRLGIPDFRGHSTKGHLTYRFSRGWGWGKESESKVQAVLFLVAGKWADLV